MKTIELSTKEKIEMREPKVRDIRLLQHVTNEEERTFKLIANLTMKSEDEINELCMKDYKTLQVGLVDFLG